MIKNLSSHSVCRQNFSTINKRNHERRSNFTSLSKRKVDFFFGLNCTNKNYSVNITKRNSFSRSIPSIEISKIQKSITKSNCNSSRERAEKFGKAIKKKYILNKIYGSSSPPLTVRDSSSPLKEVVINNRVKLFKTYLESKKAVQQDQEKWLKEKKISVFHGKIKLSDFAYGTKNDKNENHNEKNNSKEKWENEQSRKAEDYYYSLPMSLSRKAEEIHKKKTFEKKLIELFQRYRQKEIKKFKMNILSEKKLKKKHSNVISNKNVYKNLLHVVFPNIKKYK